jgi:hypothetical protein
VSNASTIRRQVSGILPGTLAAFTPLAPLPFDIATCFALNGVPGELNSLLVSNTIVTGGVVPLMVGPGQNNGGVSQGWPNDVGAVSNYQLYSGTGRVLRIRATGSVTGLANSTLALMLYEVPGSSLPLSPLVTTAAELVTAGGVLIATSVTGAVGAETGSLTFEALVQLDAEGNLEGSFTSEINSTVGQEQAITVASGLVGDADLNFVLAAIAGTADLVSVVVDEFAIDWE